MKVFITFFTLFLTLQSQANLDNGLHANLHTNQGNIILKLTFEKTPLTVINFVGLAEGKKLSNAQTGKPFYNGLKFHRVINNFMIQGGDPKGNGSGGPGYQFSDEITDLKHDSAGVLSMANSGSNTNGSQFFITHNATPWLDGKHTVFGRVVQGMDVVNMIKKGDFIRKVTITRVGTQAENFKTDEAAFQTQNKKYLANAEEKKQKKQQQFIDFVKKKYPNVQQTKTGHFVKINQAGLGKKPKKGDLVSIDLSIKLDDGTYLKKADKPLDFAAGNGRVIKLIDNAVLNMKTGEKRTLIASYAQVYGNTKHNGLSQETVLIFDLKLRSINQVK